MYRLPVISEFWGWYVQPGDYSSVQFSRLVMSDSLRLHELPGFPVYHQVPEFAQTHVHWVSDAIQLSHPLASLSPPAFNLSQHQGLFQWVSSLYQVAKVLEPQLQHPSNEYSGLISFKMYWFDLLAVPGTLKTFLQHYSSKTSILRCSGFFIVQLSHPCTTNGNTILISLNPYNNWDRDRYFHFSNETEAAIRKQLA